MTTRQFVLFLAGLLLPTIYQRTKFALNRIAFYQTPLRTKSGLDIHHGHWGLLFAFISMGLLVSGIHDYRSIGLAGFGWGLMLDEIIPMLKMPPGSRTSELDVYSKSRKATIVLVSVVAIISIFLFLVAH